MGLIGVRVRGRLFMEYDHMGHHLMNAALYDWLTEHVGLGGRSGGWIPDCQWLWCWHGEDFQQAVVVINDPIKAVLFKLTWGGA